MGGKTLHNPCLHHVMFALRVNQVQTPVCNISVLISVAVNELKETLRTIFGTCW